MAFLVYTILLFIFIFFFLLIAGVFKTALDDDSNKKSVYKVDISIESDDSPNNKRGENTSYTN